MHVGAAGLQVEQALVAALEAGQLRLRAIPFRRRFVQRSDVVNDSDVRLVDVGPGLRLQSLARDAAERMDDHRMGEADRQRARRRRVQREGEIDLVRLQIEHRIAIGGTRRIPVWRRTPWRCPWPFRCRNRSIRRWRGPWRSRAIRPAARRSAETFVRRTRSNVLSGVDCARAGRSARGRSRSNGSAAAPARARRPGIPPGVVGHGWPLLCPGVHRIVARHRMTARRHGAQASASRNSASPVAKSPG